ncbi:MAG: hypothetical protein WCI04_03340 [archaeon]
MTQTSYILISDADAELMSKSLQSGDRFTFGKINKKTALLSRKRKAGLSARSMLPTVAEAWNGFSSAQKLAWTNAGAQCGLNGYRLFTKDKCARIINDIAGNATPSLKHQAWVGNIKIQSPATEIKIVQFHPRSYWVSQAVPKHKGMRQPVLVTENFQLPLTISLNYSSNLTAVGPNAYARLYAKIWYKYQAVDLDSYIQIDLDFVSDWKFATLTSGALATIIVGYDLFFELHDLQGDLYFDNIKSTHSAQNWARDTNCDDINQGFTKAFYQIPKHWVALTLPVGAEYGSIYKDF